MGYELYRMILDGHPPEWLPQMLLVALTVADDARDPSQAGPDGWGWSAIRMHGEWRVNGDGEDEWHDGLTERTGMSERAVSRALTMLGRAGFEMRVAVRTGEDGRVFFTVPGRGLRFRVPGLPPRPAPIHPPRTSGESPERPPDRPAGHPTDSAIHPPPVALSPDACGDSPAAYVVPSSSGPPNSPLTAKSSAVNSPVEGSQGALEQDQDFSGDEGKGICSMCGQRAELMRSMTGLAIRNHKRGRDGEAFCPGTGQPPAAPEDEP
jgi:hypothetical protein